MWYFISEKYLSTNFLVVNHFGVHIIFEVIFGHLKIKKSLNMDNFVLLGFTYLSAIMSNNYSRNEFLNFRIFLAKDQ